MFSAQDGELGEFSDWLKTSDCQKNSNLDSSKSYSRWNRVCHPHGKTCFEALNPSGSGDASRFTTSGKETWLECDSSICFD